jgi:G3E family GTPase
LGESKDDPKEANDCQKWVFSTCFENADDDRQVACADVILLNKTDLVDKQQLHEVESRIRLVI